MKIFQSKALAWVILVLIIVWMVCDVVMGLQWWMFIPVFFAFMSQFCHIAALYLNKSSEIAAKKLEKISYILSWIFFISLLVANCIK